MKSYIEASEDGIQTKDEAIKVCKEQLNKLEIKVHDMRNELFPEISLEKVNAVFNLFTSFGYFDDENDDR